MQLFYQQSLELHSKHFTFSEEESKHICRVLRLKEGENIYIINGKGIRFLAQITDANPKKCQVDIIDVQVFEKPDFELHIAIAPTKNMDRIEWFIEKSTEIGITKISFLLCDNSERKTINLDRCRKILISALKQSQRMFLPEMDEMVSFDTFIKHHPKGMIAHCTEREKFTISEVFEPVNCPILIGPEGDFSKKEIQFALENNYKSITLGNNRLRTETAALVACVLANEFN